MSERVMAYPARARLLPLLAMMALGLWLAVLPAGAQTGPAGRAYLMEVRGPVTPVTQAYIERGIRQAQADGVAALVMVLNTPGGSLNITREIVEKMRASTVPIVVYVAPEGATAASAGTILTLAGHAAGMAPGTSIGAASPVSGQGGDLTETERRKAENIIIADLKSLAERRGPAALEWVERAVTESAALTAQEAAEIGVVDAVAATPEALLEAIDGLEVPVAGRLVTLETAGLALTRLPMNSIEGFLHTILDPNIAFILMTIGINAILFELSSPGGYVAGIIGGVCLLLALLAFGVLSVNWAGLALIALAFVLFIAEIETQTSGVLTAMGLVSFVLGSLILFNSPMYQVSRVLIVTVALTTAGFFAFIVAKAMAIRRRPAATGRENLLGAVAVVRRPLDPAGMVFLRGELWRAESAAGPVPAGARVRVVAAEGLRLRVEPLEPSS